MGCLSRWLRMLRAPNGANNLSWGDVYSWNLHSFWRYCSPAKLLSFKSCISWSLALQVSAAAPQSFQFCRTSKYWVFLLDPPWQGVEVWPKWAVPRLNTSQNMRVEAETIFRWTTSLSFFIRPMCTWGLIYGSWRHSLNHRPFADLTDVTLADDTNSILTDDANRTIPGRQYGNAIGDTWWPNIKEEKCRHLLAKSKTNENGFIISSQNRPSFSCYDCLHADESHL